MAEIESTLEMTTKVAGSDLSAHQYNIMQDIGNGQIRVASEAVNFAICGVLMNKPAAAGRHASVATRGPGKVRAGAAINTVQVFLTTNGSGRAIAASSGEIVIGMARETATADGDIISAILIPPFRLSGSPTR